MPTVHVSITRDNAAVCMFDDEPFAAVVNTGLGEWSIYDPRQWDSAASAFVGRPACGVSATREHGVRVACAHIG